MNITEAYESDGIDRNNPIHSNEAMTRQVGPHESHERVVMALAVCELAPRLEADRSFLSRASLPYPLRL